MRIAKVSDEEMRCRMRQQSRAARTGGLTVPGWWQVEVPLAALGHHMAASIVSAASDAFLRRGKARCSETCICIRLQLLALPARDRSSTTHERHTRSPVVSFELHIAADTHMMVNWSTSASFGRPATKATDLATLSASIIGSTLMLPSAWSVPLELCAERSV